MSFQPIGEMILVGGVSGAGKSTLCEIIAEEFAPGVYVTNERVNRDFFLGRGSKPEIFRRQIELTRELRLLGLTFIVEHTLKGSYPARLIEEVRAANFLVTIIFLRVKDFATAVERVQKRASLGGHNVAPDEIRARLEGGLRNFELLRDRVDFWFDIDNSVEFELVAGGNQGGHSVELGCRAMEVARWLRAARWKTADS